jgi:glyceraldehyde 3-phosphate dehydrogenase
MRNMALHSPMRRQIDYSNSPEVVSTDFVGSRTACVYDAQATIVNGSQAVLYLWYDNEFGYSCQVYRILERWPAWTISGYPQGAEGRPSLSDRRRSALGRAPPLNPALSSSNERIASL